MNKLTEPAGDWSALDALQEKILAWQKDNFPDTQEWELALGVCEEAGELAQCVLKLHRGMRQHEFDEARLKDAVGDVTIFLIGLCGSRGWLLSDVLKSTSEKVLARDWK